MQLAARRRQGVDWERVVTRRGSGVDGPRSNCVSEQGEDPLRSAGDTGIEQGVVLFLMVT